MERDADTIKRIGEQYMATINDTVKDNQEDVDELARVLTRITADIESLKAVHTKLAEYRNSIIAVRSKKAEMADILSRSVRERGQV